MAVIALAAFAAAGPLIGRGGARQHWPSDIAIVLDNSASTSRLHEDRPIFEMLRRAALAGIDLAGPADRFWVHLTVGGPLRLGVDAAEAREAILAARPSDGYGDIADAVSRAVSSLPPRETASRRDYEAHLLSDLQATGLRAAVLTGVAAPLVVYDPPDGTFANDAITAAGHSEGAHPPSRVPLFLQATVERFPPTEAAEDSALIRLELDGSTIDAATVNWGEQAMFRIPGQEAGSRYVRMEIEPSGLRSDDAVHLAFQVLDPPPVELSARQESFLALAVATLRDAGRIGEAGGTVRFLEFGPEALTSRPAAGDPGAVVFIPPADPIELPRLNQRLADASVPWAAAASEERGALAVSFTGPSTGASLDLRDVRVFRRYRLRPTADGTADSVLIRASDGSPWLVRGRAANSTYLVLASPLSPEASTLPTSATMVPFVERLLQWSVAESAVATNHLAGETVQMPAGADSVQAPGAEAVRVDAGTPVRLTKAGLYRVFRDADTVQLTANVPPEEHDPRSIDKARLPELFPELDVVTAGPEPSQWTRQVYRSRRGRDATAWILGIVSLLLVIETLIATPGRENRKRTA